MSVLDLIDTEFNTLTSLTLDGSAVHSGLPQRPISVVALKSVLLHPATPFAARDAALTELVRLARGGDEQWMTALLGVLIPGIRRTSGKLATQCKLDCEDLEAEVVSGVVNAIHNLPDNARNIAASLTWAGFRRGMKSCCEAAVVAGQPSKMISDSVPPPRFGGHPDFILDDAVVAGVITRAEAELIGATRLDGVALTKLAEELVVSDDTMRHRRNRAERRLVEWLNRQR